VATNALLAGWLPEAKVKVYVLLDGVTMYSW
jgi:hypothetical protein